MLRASSELGADAASPTALEKRIFESNCCAFRDRCLVLCGFYEDLDKNDVSLVHMNGPVPETKKADSPVYTTRVNEKRRFLGCSMRIVFFVPTSQADNGRKIVIVVVMNSDRALSSPSTKKEH